MHNNISCRLVHSQENIIHRVRFNLETVSRLLDKAADSGQVV
jgi:hypothetical protein